MLTSELDFDLPPELIAQAPPVRRGDSRLLVVAAGSTGPFVDGAFADTLLDQLRPDDLVVANDTRVLHARLRLARPGGGAAEALLLEPVANDGEGSRWRAMLRPARRLRDGMALSTTARETVVAEGRDADHDGCWIVRLPVDVDAAPGWLLTHGEVPLPPYIAPGDQDPARYQTVYADAYGSVAAPTAGLHFDQQLWSRVRERCEVAHVTLHVGAGTFQPVRVDDLTEHDMHAERYTVPPATDAAVRAALAAGRRVVAVGTTSTRVLESVYGPTAMPLEGSTRLFVTPGYEPACVGAMLTNFHLPRSTLLALVMAFAGTDTIRAAYAAAIERRLRFFSFGDAMLLVREDAADA